MKTANGVPPPDANATIRSDGKCGSELGSNRFHSAASRMPPQPVSSRSDGIAGQGVNGRPEPNLRKCVCVANRSRCRAPAAADAFDWRDRGEIWSDGRQSSGHLVGSISLGWRLRERPARPVHGGGRGCGRAERLKRRPLLGRCAGECFSEHEASRGSAKGAALYISCLVGRRRRRRLWCGSA